MRRTGDLREVASFRWMSVVHAMRVTRQLTALSNEIISLDGNRKS
jgi:hypothetical protein